MVKVERQNLFVMTQV